ncbi:MAG: ABC transporter ATP-binding protein, partial [Paracoccaceae bacterium]|nr:ABC transporter ATP-binding protein [Paracoccaceae bacterium]
MALLEVTGLKKRFGGLAALDDVSFSVKEGAIHGVIGPNGAGKTTLFNVVSGYYHPSSGKITFKNQDVTGRQPSAIAALGLVRTFQRVALFPKFTVLENISVARHLHAKEGLLGAIFGTSRSMEKAADERSREIAEFLHLGQVMNEKAMNLAHGHQRVLNVAMALATEPKLLMLDEPVAGMNSAETELMTVLIRKIRDDWGVTVLLVEHDMRTVMGLCETITVLDFGKKLAEG